MKTIASCQSERRAGRGRGGGGRKGAKGSPGDSSQRHLEAKTGGLRHDDRDTVSLTVYLYVEVDGLRYALTCRCSTLGGKSGKDQLKKRKEGFQSQPCSSSSFSRSMTR